jgi:hypothetical protein
MLLVAHALREEPFESKGPPCAGHACYDAYKANQYVKLNLVAPKRGNPNRVKSSELRVQRSGTRGRFPCVDLAYVLRSLTADGLPLWFDEDGPTIQRDKAFESSAAQAELVRAHFDARVKHREATARCCLPMSSNPLM